MSVTHLHWTAFRTIVTKEVLRFVRIWIQTLLPPGITMGLYFLIFGHLIGSRLGPMDGMPYADYIMPGVILLAVITNSYSNVVSSFYSTKFQRHVEELLVSPVPEWVVLAGYVAGGVARGLAVAVVVMVVAMFFADLQVHHPWVSLSVLVLTSILFALAGFINAVFAKSFDDISIIPTFVLTPLTYLGGVFYSIEVLPEFWQGMSQGNPILYMVNAFRYGLLGVTDVNLPAAYAIILGFIAVLWAIGWTLLRRGVGIKS
jgi:ABC-2 type transport system permease protein